MREPPQSRAKEGGVSMAERQLPRGHGTSMSPESFAQQWSQVRRELK